MQEVLEDLNTRLEEGRPVKVLSETGRMNRWFSEYASSNDEAEIYALRGSAHLALENPEDALVCFNRALKLDPLNGRALLGIIGL